MRLITCIPPLAVSLIRWCALRIRESTRAGAMRKGVRMPRAAARYSLCSRFAWGGGPEKRGERLPALRAAPADEQVGAAHGLAAPRTGGKLVPRSLGDGGVGGRRQLLAPPRRLQAELASPSRATAFSRSPRRRASPPARTGSPPLCSPSRPCSRCSTAPGQGQAAGRSVSLQPCLSASGTRA